MSVLKPFTVAHEGEMFLCYAEDEADARLLLSDTDLPEDCRVREQPERKPSEFVYTHPARGNVPATLIGSTPAHLLDEELPAPDES